MFASHLMPVPNDAITFTVYRRAGVVVKKVCPGRTYTVELMTPTLGYALLTASAGTLTTTGMLADTMCPGRVVFDPISNFMVQSKQFMWTAVLALPCSVKGSFVQLSATYAADSQDAFNHNSINIPVDTPEACIPTTCSSSTTTTTTSTPAPTTTAPASPATTPSHAPTTTTSPPASTTTPHSKGSAGGGEDDGGGEGEHADSKPEGTDHTTTSPSSSPSNAPGDGSTAGDNPTAETASPSPNTTTTTTTSSRGATINTASAGGVIAATFLSGMCKQPVTTKGSACTPSSLGYSCSATVSGVTTHWTIGGCPPSNPCTKTYTLRNPSASAAQSYLHYAASYPTTGYVSVGFTQNAGRMPGTDAVIGWVNADGTPTIDSYHIPGTSVSRSNLVSSTNQWMVLAGASQQGGVTTVCFSRPVAAPTASVAQALPAVGDVPMNWAVGRSNQRSLTQHTSAGGFSFNPSTGKASAASSIDYSLVHGLMMAAAWVVLAPMGVLFARHKWALGEKKLCGVHWWFHAHRAIQMLAVLLFVLGFVLAFVKLDDPRGGVGKAHKWLAFVMAGLAGLQVLAAFIRPSGDSDQRRAWNLFHWNLGRLTLTAGIVNTFLGIIVYHNKEQKSVGVWFVAASLCVAFWLALETVLSLLGWRQRRAKASKYRQTDVEVTNVNAKPGYHVYQ